MDLQISEEEILKELSEISPSSWSNIPSPIIAAISTLVKLFKYDHECLIALKAKPQEASENLSSPSVLSSYPSLNQSRRNDEALMFIENKLKSGLADNEMFMHSQIKRLEKLTNDSIEENNKQIKEISQKIAAITRSCHKNEENFAAAIISWKDELTNDFSMKLKEETNSLSAEIKDISDYMDRFEKAMKNSILLIENETQNHLAKTSLEMKAEVRLLKSSSDKGNENTLKLITAKIDELTQNSWAFNMKICDAIKDLDSKMVQTFYKIDKKEKDATNKLDGIVNKALYKVNMIDDIIIQAEKSRNGLIEELKAFKEEINEFLEKKSTKLAESHDKKLLNIKEDLRGYLDDELIFIKKKLEWLPMDFSEIKDFNSVEARLYVLETRLRTEENNRISEREKIHQEILNIKIDHKPQIKVTASRPKCSTPMAHRSKTRNSQIIRKTISPGGVCSIDSWRTSKTPKSSYLTFTRSFQTPKGIKQFDFTKDSSIILQESSSESRPKSPDLEQTAILERYNNEARHLSIVTACFPSKPSSFDIKQNDVNTNI
ncbi:unnamed protein product [Blepharisma stoltei]|uniref:Uncharacterized protein n=1 Tax=Blepharisma stoltei TaxID=1481888 RepID=A0AAU9JSG9_9CILI|nr:unnamed protein product [Blepharisma stoltei]